MDNFMKDDKRGKVGAVIIERYHSRINYNEPLPRFKSFFTAEGTATPREGTAKWEEISGNNENKDYVAQAFRHEVMIEIKHEAKTDYKCYLGEDKHGEYTPTCNLFIEVDTAAIANPHEVRNMLKPVQKRGYFNPNAIGEYRNADYYHFLIAMYERAIGNQSENFGTRSARLLAEELEAFRSDERIPDCDSILSSTPIEAGLILSNAGLKMLLEKHAGIKWTDNPQRSGERCGILLPIREVIKDVNFWNELQGHACITALPETWRKNPNSKKSGHVWVTQRMVDAYVQECSLTKVGEVTLGSFIKSTIEQHYPDARMNGYEGKVEVLLFADRKSYGGVDKGREPFPVIDELRKLKIYPTDAPMVKI